jgi:hypothetical protein
MSGTKRNPIVRPSKNLQITAHVLALFEITEQGRGQRDLAIIKCDSNEFGFCRLTCGPCEAWSSAHAELHELLGLQPWFWPCLPISPFPPGSQKSQDWRPSRPEWELWWALEKARQAAAEAKPAA